MTKPADQIAKARKFLESRGLADLSLYWPTDKPIPQIDYASGEAQPTLLQPMAAFAASERQAVIDECAKIAGGMTGPGNTPEQCQGYSDACRDIQRAIRSME